MSRLVMFPAPQEPGVMLDTKLEIGMRFIRYRRPVAGDLWMMVVMNGSIVAVIPLKEDNGPPHKVLPRWPRLRRGLPPKPWPKPQQRRIVPFRQAPPPAS